MSKSAIAAICLALGLAGSGAAMAKPAAGEAFINKAVQGNLAEIQMGQLAQQNSQTQEVRTLGQQLVTDHTNANQQATSVATQLGVTPPTEPNAKQRAEYNKLSKLNGPAFDKQFAAVAVADHRKDIREYKAEAKKSGPAATYASTTLPVLQQHLTMAQSLKGASH